MNFRQLFHHLHAMRTLHAFLLYLAFYSCSHAVHIWQEWQVSVGIQACQRVAQQAAAAAKARGSYDNPVFCAYAWATCQVCCSTSSFHTTDQETCPQFICGSVNHTAMQGTAQKKSMLATLACSLTSLLSPPRTSNDAIALRMQQINLTSATSHCS